jgi:hypothetical protein
MPESRSFEPLGTRFRSPIGPPARRTFVEAVVTELAAVLEPVGRDPFIDGSDDVPRLGSMTAGRGRMTDLRCAGPERVRLGRRA